MFLDVRDLTITLKTGEEIAKDISFSIDGGEMLSIVGSSGAGKTTVCKAVMGLLSSLIIPFQVRCFIGGKTCCTVQRNDCRQSTVKKYAILCKTP